MTTYTWPNTGRHRPEDAVEHATCLKADFDLVSNTANVSLSKATLLPSGLESRISIGITKGIAEACSNGYCPKWSEIDKSIFSKVMLKNITTAAALEARDRIPLPQFHGLHESFNVLYPKLAKQIPPTETTHQFVGAGAGAATEATSVVDLVNAARKGDKETDSDRIPEKPVVVQPEEKTKDVNGEESGNDTSEEESDESEDAEEVQEVIGSKDSKSVDDFSEDGSDDGSGSEEESEEDCETDSDAGSEEEEVQDIVREESVPNINKDGSGFSTTVNLEIEQQASVNQLEGMTALELSNCLSSSLRKFLRKQQLSSRVVHIFGASLLDNGDVKVVLHAETREVVQKMVDSAGWHQDLERTLNGSPVPTYKVRMHDVKMNSMKFQNRKEKSATIRKIADANRAIGRGDGVSPSIRDICWSQYWLPSGGVSLIVEFLNPEEATRTLIHGLYWQKRRYGCIRPESDRVLQRCGTCQGYGHLDTKCSAPHRCGKRAGQHPTATCESKTRKCPSCGGGHHAGNNCCPTKIEAKRSLGFLNEIASQATETAAEAQATPSPSLRHSISAARTQTKTSMPSPVSLDDNPAEDEIKSEPDESLPKAHPTQDNYPDTATLLQQIEDLRKVVLARDTALQTKSTGPTKRRAGEAFEGGAEAESSNMAAKRIKQEQPTREDSMGLYRQPSPYIVNRPQ